MKQTVKDVKNVQIAYIGGGSRAWAHNLMNDLALEEEIGGTVRLYDIDMEGAKINEKIGNDLSARSDVKGKWIYKAYEKIGDALSGADFVVISVLPGTFDEMESDVHLPEEYGIYQPVGDTTGPGGIIRALRCLPMFREFALAIKEYCPNAWVINFTNPMSICVKTLYDVFPEIKAFGCCHEVFHAQKLLTVMLKELRGIETDRKGIYTDACGINHFTWLDKAYYGTTDILPLYREFVKNKQSNQNLQEGELPPNIAELFETFLEQVETLTVSEKRILHFYIEGYDAAEITEKAFLSMSTVRKHSGNIYRKLNISSRDELMLYVDLFGRCNRLGELYEHSKSPL